MAYFAKLYGVVQYVGVARGLLQRPAPESSIIKICLVRAFNCRVPRCNVHFSICPPQRFALSDIWTQNRRCKSVLVAAVEVPEAACQVSAFKNENSMGRTAYRPTSL